MRQKVASNHRTNIITSLKKIVVKQYFIYCMGNQELWNKVL